MRRFRGDGNGGHVCASEQLSLRHSLAHHVLLRPAIRRCATLATRLPPAGRTNERTSERGERASDVCTAIRWRGLTDNLQERLVKFASNYEGVRYLSSPLPNFAKIFLQRTFLKEKRVHILFSLAFLIGTGLISHWKRGLSLFITVKQDLVSVREHFIKR